MALVDSIIGAESRGNPYARNPRSSAAGLGQFIDSTWLSMIQKYRPDLAGQDRASILALKTNPDLSREMTARYAEENAAGLKSSGFDPTPGNTYLAHFAGLGGARSVLGADPSTPVANLLDPSAVAANPFLKNMTAGDLVAWAGSKVPGGAETAPGAAAPPLPPPIEVASLGAPQGLLAPSHPEPPAQDATAQGQDPFAQLSKGLLAPQQPQQKPQDPFALLADDGGLLAQRPRQFQLGGQPMQRTRRFA